MTTTTTTTTTAMTDVKPANSPPVGIAISDKHKEGFLDNNIYEEALTSTSTQCKSGASTSDAYFSSCSESSMDCDKQQQQQQHQHQHQQQVNDLSSAKSYEIPIHTDDTLPVEKGYGITKECPPLEQEDPEEKRDVPSVQPHHGNNPINAEDALSIENEDGLTKECPLSEQVVEDITDKVSERDELAARVLRLEEQIETMHAAINQLTDVLNQKSDGASSNLSPERIKAADSIVELDSPPELEKTNNSSPVIELEGSAQPSLEYRSYTPNYEEELRKIRKCSRGMSIDAGDSNQANTSLGDRSSAERDDNGSNLSGGSTKLFSDAQLSEKEMRLTTGKTNKENTALIEKLKIPCSPKRLTKSESKTEMDQLIAVQDTGGGRIGAGKENDSTISATKDDSGATKLDCSEIQNKSNPVFSIFRSLNLDSQQQDGSATEDVDANMEEFLRVPSRLEGLMLFGVSICADSFLHVLAVTPLKFVWSLMCLVCTILRPRKGIGPCRFHRRHLYQIIRVFVIFAVCEYCLNPISVGKMYHWIRGQAMLKLYVLMAMVEVFDRLMCSLGQDALDSLYWNTTRRPTHPRMLISTIVVLVYAMIHSFILFVHIATLNVAMNSRDQALLSLLIGGNFAEIKSTVFKKYNKQNLFKITTSDICERFKLALFLGLILLLNCCQGGMNQEMVNAYIYMAALILFAEILCDWTKHSFITKFNFIKSSAYPDYSLILAGDITGVGTEKVNIDHSHAIVKRIGFAQIPLVCVMIRYLREAARYTDVLSAEGDSNHVLHSIAVAYTGGSWSVVGSMLIASYIILLVLKVCLGHSITKAAHAIIIYGTSDVQDKTEAESSNHRSHRRQAV